MVILQQYHELADAYRQVIASDRPIPLPTITAYKLESIGLVKLIKDEVVCSCQLYRLYFENKL